MVASKMTGSQGSTPRGAKVPFAAIEIRRRAFATSTQHLWCTACYCYLAHRLLLL